MNREYLDEDKIRDSLSDLHSRLESKLDRHGNGALVSSHECLGVVTEEYHELDEAVRSNDFEQIKAELLDVAIAALWGFMSLKK